MIALSSSSEATFRAGAVPLTGLWWRRMIRFVAVQELRTKASRSATATGCSRRILPISFYCRTEAGFRSVKNEQVV